MSIKAFSAAGLERRRAILDGYVERGDVPGLVSSVSRHGEQHVDVLGSMAFNGAPMRRDAIFRIASLSKPILAVAAMILVEECVLRLDDPVDRFLPELADRRVLRRIDGPLDDTVPAVRPITLRDLLTLRMGFGNWFDDIESPPIEQAVIDLGVETLGAGNTTLPPDQWIARLGTLPLIRQPGTSWMYNTPHWVLCVLVARAAGQPLEQFLHQRIFAPLGMVDTAFFVAPTRLHRLATAYAPDDAGALILQDDHDEISRPPAFPAELVSTVDDLHAFGQMLLNKGRLGAERILSRASVELMTINHLTPEQRAEGAVLLGENGGWGFGMAVVVNRDGVAASPGRYGWDGGSGTSLHADPAEDMSAILLTQVPWTTPASLNLWSDFWTATYAALDT